MPERSHSKKQWGSWEQARGDVGIFLLDGYIAVSKFHFYGILTTLHSYAVHWRIYVGFCFIYIILTLKVSKTSSIKIEQGLIRTSTDGVCLVKYQSSQLTYYGM